MKKNSIFFFVFVFTFYYNFSYAQENLGFPYKIDFTEDEIKTLLKLDQETLKKLILIATLVKNQKMEEALKKANEVTKQDTYSNNYSPNTPYYDPRTGVYSSRPPSNPTSPQTPFTQSPFQSLSPFLGGGISPYSFSGGSSFGGSAPSGDISMDFQTVCKTSSGQGRITGSTGGRNWEDVNPKLKADVLKASELAGKPFYLVSGRRSQAQQDNICASGGTGAKACGVKVSCHVRGCAVDLNFSGLNEAEKVKAILVFLSFGYSIITYGPETPGVKQANNHVHIGMDGGPETWLTVQSNGDAPLYVRKAFLLAKISQKRLPRSTLSANANTALKEICK